MRTTTSTPARSGGERRGDRFQRIALIVGQDIGYCRGVLRGVQSFAASSRKWVFRDAAPSMAVAAALREWNPDGIIAHLFDPAIAKALMRLRKPLVNVTSTLDLDVPLVEVDHVAIGHMAADHFIDSGFKHFAYFGSAVAGFSIDRERGFRERLAAKGFECRVHHAEYLPRPDPSASWKATDESVHRWVLSLPQPIAIFASNDIPARELADVCRNAGLNVPEQVAILGVDNDELECGLSFPPLSSIAIPSHQVGFEAARMLGRLMDGDRVEPKQVFFKPDTVVVRQSSDIVAVDDEYVSHALRYIRQHATSPIDVSDVLREVTVSRRKLERAFQKVIHRTIFAEIRRLRVERARQLLAATNLPIPAVAAKSGLETPRRLAVVFGRMTGMTPTAYRARHRVK